DLFKLESNSRHPHGMTDEEYDMIFTKDKPIIFAFHGYPTLIHELTYTRHNRNLIVKGYNEEGTITTPFDMRVQNEIDRFNLVKTVIYNLKNCDSLSKYASIMQEMNDKLVDHKEYIAEYGEDMPEVKNWKW
ncbi:MAG: phosphoketolase, partial [Clostridia bacterium]|nr:phosphoketolase [Clostridia bacterium]